MLKTDILPMSTFIKGKKMILEFIGNKLAIDPVIIPNIIGKLSIIFMGISAIAAIIIQILDLIVEQKWQRLTNNQRKKVKKLHAKAYNFWENHSPKIKFWVLFTSNLSAVVRSIQIISSWNL